MAAHGAQVVCANRNYEAGPATAWGAAGGDGWGEPSAYELDVLDDEAQVRRAAKGLGDVDVLVFTAATNVRKKVLDYSGEKFDRVVSHNLRTSFDLLRVRTGDGRAGTPQHHRLQLDPGARGRGRAGQGVHAATKAGWCSRCALRPPSLALRRAV